VFSLHPDGIYRVPAFGRFDWLEHGFGTRRADIVPLFPQLATLKQIHSAACVPAGGASGVLGEGDALLENRPGAVVAVKTADCLPILLVDVRNRAVAAVHAGWRGVAGHIVERAVESIREQFGTGPRDLHAAIGPGAGACCYEVGPEVAAQFGIEGRTKLDLAGIARERLIASGVTPARIHASNLCTICRPDELHSFRRDRERAGRQYSFAGIRAAVQ
jgi:hypothetical protein